MNDTKPSGLGDYEIKVRSHLDDKKRYWFEGMTITTGYDDEGRPLTTLIGQLSDQAALQGVLAIVRDMNLTLISVNSLAVHERHDLEQTGE